MNTASGRWTAPNLRFAAFAFAALIYMLAVYGGMLVPLFTGLLTFWWVESLSRALVGRLGSSGRAKWIAVSTIAILVVGLLTAVVTGAMFFFKPHGMLEELLQEMADAVDSSRAWLPAFIAKFLPPRSELLGEVGRLLREHAAMVGNIGLGALKVLGYALLGMLLGAMIAFADIVEYARLGPVANQLMTQMAAVRLAFARIISAQVKISVLNTTLTGLYLAVALPLMGVHLPFTKTMIVVTFVCGLLPVVGNLISNVVIFLLSLHHSFGAAIGALTYLIVIHKLEYFFNARIVGGEIKAKAWEILLVMLLMERVFGPVGVVAAPVFYAWFKDEWRRWDVPKFK
ncbi:AI-2E family transporter [Chitinivorax sp. B]|uniref:AI-2E family transporter n=1 Tax=Chitinivorax sp. B TaxID=2502235 RepID=UPI0010F56855|nr:AI-2E family transporter [Chitinivorax sp. B]